jgi:hypothetical protein
MDFLKKKFIYIFFLIHFTKKKIKKKKDYKIKLIKYIYIYIKYYKNEKFKKKKKIMKWRFFAITCGYSFFFMEMLLN